MEEHEHIEKTVNQWVADHMNGSVVARDPVVLDYVHKAVEQLTHQLMTTRQDGEPADKAIDHWFVDHMHGSVVAHDVDAYNHLHKSVADLKRRLRTILG